MAAWLGSSTTYGKLRLDSHSRRKIIIIVVTCVSCGERERGCERGNFTFRRTTVRTFRRDEEADLRNDRPAEYNVLNDAMVITQHGILVTFSIV